MFKMKMSKSIGVRKGAWTQDEDSLLRKCIQKFGEGKWHQVPLKAGLNRCRKSCRLRWLNYLKPDIKRGEFVVDEVDLLIRLHNLLGNRWSLIAGRIPGRTANDVKNYWNTHLRKKLATPKEKPKPRDHVTTIIKPRPRTFSRNLYCSTNHFNSIINNTSTKQNIFNLPPPEVKPADDGIQWWKDLFNGKETGGDEWCIGGSDVGDPQLSQTFSAQQVGDNVQEGPNAGSDLSLDMDIWQFLYSDQYSM